MFTKEICLLLHTTVAFKLIIEHFNWIVIIFINFANNVSFLSEIADHTEPIPPDEFKQGLEDFRAKTFSTNFNIVAKRALVWNALENRCIALCIFLRYS